MANPKKRTVRDRTPPMRTKPTDQPNEVFADEDVLPDKKKLSAKLLEIMDPWLDEMDLTLLADCACIAWNACVDGDDNEDYFSIDFMTNSVDSRSEHAELVNQLKIRKNTMFPYDQRTIVRMQVHVDESDGPKLLVASRLNPENLKNAMTSFRKRLDAAKHGDKK